MSSSLKALSKQMKQKGLKRLRWYCEMCQKQCRDANGFKSHQLSEGHLRMMSVFRENPEAFQKRFSDEFEAAFLQVLRRRGQKMVSANVVYQEMIADKQHVHMNSTQWTSLSEFVQYLGREKKAIVELKPRGWHIQHIRRDEAMKRRQEAAKQLEATQLSEQQRFDRMVKERLAAAERERGHEDPGASEEKQVLQRDSNDEVVAFSLESEQSKPALAAAAAAASAPVQVDAQVKNAFGAATRKRKPTVAGFGVPASKKTKKAATSSALEQLKATIESGKQSSKPVAPAAAAAPAPVADPHEFRPEPHSESWVLPGIVVKIKNRKLLSGKLYKAKAVVEAVPEEFTAKIATIRGKTKVQIDQDELQTVLPSLGKRVLVLDGVHRGKTATLLRLHTKRHCVDVQLADSGDELRSVPYKAVSKLA